MIERNLKRRICSGWARGASGYNVRFLAGCDLPIVRLDGVARFDQPGSGFVLIIRKNGVRYVELGTVSDCLVLCGEVGGWMGCGGG